MDTNIHNNKRVLFITPLPPPVHGSAMMSQFIKESELINQTFDCDYVNLSTSRSMKEIGNNGWRKIFRLSESFFKTFWRLATKKYDLCYLAITCHGAGFLKDFPFVMLCKMFGHKIVIHQHNKGMSRDVDRKPYKWLMPLAYKNAIVILLSERLYPDISKAVDRGQVMICPNGIPQMYDGKLSLERNNPVPRILFLSNLIESKGVYVLLDACKILKDRGLKFKCIFVGGETKEITREIFEDEVRKRGLDEWVNYAGRKYGQDKEDEFIQADIFTQPTYEDCFPLTLVEAMQYHLPIATTDEGGISDMVEHLGNGLISISKDEASLANNLELLLKDKNLRIALGEKGYEIYRSKFTKEAFEQRLKSVLTNVIGGG